MISFLYYIRRQERRYLDDGRAVVVSETFEPVWRYIPPEPEICITDVTKTTLDSHKATPVSIHDNAIDGDHAARTSLSRVAMVANREIAIPDGWKIAKGKIRRRDMYLNYYIFAKTGVIEWCRVFHQDLEYHAHTDCYALPIRQKGGGE